MYLVLIFDKLLYRFLPILSKYDFVALCLKNDFEEFSYFLIILRHKYSLCPTWRQRFNCFYRFFLFRFSCGKIYIKRCPFTQFAIDIYISIVLFDNAIYHCKPKAGTFSNLFGGKKRLEDFCRSLNAHADPGVREGN